ncbi:hypothetical protein ZYGR_0AS06160 [Zygosaccharomyces rouxii]|uniref:Uncharacterized protein n=1 Tax=Zygosaccharomyces rouxii TaxID=4956 RepID=A0A1Q3AI29_ZYGRO|nr:hypothetical protein ZYGR_0AS06160 [Zygosaccharomyces rouxii]
MSLPNLKTSRSFPSEENSDNVTKPISSAVLRRSSVPSPTHVDPPPQENLNQSNLSELLKSSWKLQNEINSTFEELCGVNRQVRVDIDDFCHIRDNSTTNINNATEVE